ncbi:MAG TPA: S1/P1 nuclease [Pyrinomonadaceae bacterium]|jgi:hypothetical protein
MLNENENENDDSRRTTDEGVATAQGLLEAVLDKLKEVGAGDEPSRMFPNGIGSVDVEVGVGDGRQQNLRVSLKLGSAGCGAEADEEAEIRFNSEGHHVIALIAITDLEERSPQAFEAVQQILLDGDRTVIEAAEFPDTIRNQQPETKPFHYVDIPLQANGPLNPPLPDPPHVLTKMAEFTELLAGGGGNAQEKVNNLSWLFHLFGDVHQPLHCAERFNQFHRRGDGGGNGFRLRGRKDNLHSLWDSSVNVSRAVDEEELRDEIMQEHTRDSLATDLQVTDTERWARASFSLAKRHAYILVEDPSNPPRPPADYLRKMERVGRRQAALGGYRLSDRLAEIFGS